MDYNQAIIQSKVYLTQKGIIDKVKFLVADFLDPFKNKIEKISSKPDAIFLSRILNDWDDINAVRILNNCRSALTSEGTIYIFELVQPEDPKIDTYVFLSLNLIALTGGKVRNLNEFRDLLKKSNLSISSHKNFGLITVLTVTTLK